MMLTRFRFKNQLVGILLITIVTSICACGGNGNKEILGSYSDPNCEYIGTSVDKKYRYSDYIIDDITDGAYKLTSPSLADFKLNNSTSDYDISAYNDAKLEYELKDKRIKSFSDEIYDTCRLVRDGYYIDKNTMIYFHDIDEDKTKLLSQNPVTNLKVDPDIPYVFFSTKSNKKDDGTGIDIRKRKIRLSDIIVLESTPEEYMRIMLLNGKEFRGYYRDQRIEDSTRTKRATSSRISSLD